MLLFGRAPPPRPLYCPRVSTTPINNSAHSAYSLSKLCDIIFTLQLAEFLKHQGSNIKVHSVILL